MTSPDAGSALQRAQAKAQPITRRIGSVEDWSAFYAALPDDELMAYAIDSTKRLDVAEMARRLTRAAQHVEALEQRYVAAENYVCNSELSLSELHTLATPAPWSVLESNNSTLVLIETGEGHPAGQGVLICSMTKKRLNDALLIADMRNELAARTSTSAEPRP